tara:strand:- start:892 stop:1101 length:210 start_codon:yes stop_codon:yes gene_type:complete
MRVENSFISTFGVLTPSGETGGVTFFSWHSDSPQQDLHEHLHEFIILDSPSDMACITLTIKAIFYIFKK